MFRAILRVSLTLILILLMGLGSGIPTVYASVRTLEEAPGQVLSQSRHSLKDNLGNTWQVIFFKRVKPDGSTIINLRLVDFPGRAIFSHPQPLVIKTNQQQSWEAEDIFAEKSPAANVGQFDLQTIITQIPNFAELELNLPLENEENVSIQIPGVVVLEWQSLI